MEVGNAGRNLISVIVPAYNCEPYVEQCITSIQRQSVGNIEIIIIDDGSKDNTLALCEGIRRSDSRIKIVPKTNEGVSTARNDGIAMATGDFIAFVDADDYVASDIFAPMQKKMHDHDADICLSNFFIDSDGVITDKTSFPKEIILNGKNEITKSMIIPMLGGTALGIHDDSIPGYLFTGLYRASVIRKYNLRFVPSLRIGEDLLFNLRFLQRAECCVCLNHAGYFYRQSKSSATRGYRTELWEKCKALQAEKTKFLKDNNLSGKDIDLRVGCILAEFALICIENEITHALANGIGDKIKKISSIFRDKEVLDAVRIVPLSKTSLLMVFPLILLKYPWPGKAQLLIAFYRIKNYFIELRRMWR